MGTRYEPRTPAPRGDGVDDRRLDQPTTPANGARHPPDTDEYDDYDDEDFESEEAPVHVERSGPSPSEIAMWDALDRGEDPSR